MFMSKAGDGDLKNKVQVSNPKSFCTRVASSAAAMPPAQAPHTARLSPPRPNI